MAELCISVVDFYFKVFCFFGAISSIGLLFFLGGGYSPGTEVSTYTYLGNRLIPGTYELIPGCTYVVHNTYPTLVRR